VEGKTPGYLIREELKRWLLRSRAGRRARSFEERLEEGRGGSASTDVSEGNKG